MLPDRQAPRHASVPDTILDDVAADPAGLYPHPKTRKSGVPDNNIPIRGSDPLDNRLAELFANHQFTPGSLPTPGKQEVSKGKRKSAKSNLPHRGAPVDRIPYNGIP